MLKNAYFLLIRTLLISFIGFFSIRELLSVLGVEQFGLLNLIFGVATLFTFLNSAMVSANQRYFSFNLGKKNYNALEQVWKSSLILHLIIAFIVFVLLFLLKNLILCNLLKIDKIFLKDASYIYNFAVISVIVSVIQTPFNAMVLAWEKMSIFSLISLLDAFLKLIIIFILYFFDYNVLRKYVFLYLIINILILMIYVSYCVFALKKSIVIGLPKKEYFKEMFFYSSWSIFGNFSHIVRLQGNNIILNIFFGVVLNSVYFITNTLIGVVTNLVNSVVTAMNPRIYKTFAQQDFEKNKELIFGSSKFGFLLCYLIAIPIIHNTDYVLEIWLKDVPEYTVDFVQLALVVLLIDSLSGGLMTGIQASGKIKVYQITVSFIILMNLPLSYILLKTLNNQFVIYYVAIFLALLSFIARLFFLKKQINFKVKEYINMVLMKILFVIFSSQFLLYLISYIKIETNFLNLVVSSSVIILVILFSIYTFGLNVKEKNFLNEKLYGLKK